MSLDPRVTPARPDLAAAYLSGQVKADRYVEGVEARVRTGFASMAGEPSFEARQTTQLLYGETFTVYDDRDDWVWGQNLTDGYVGWIRLETLAEEGPDWSHVVTALRSFVFSAPDVKSPTLDILSLASLVTVTGQKGKWCELHGGGWVFADHLGAMGVKVPDIAGTALKFLGTPYLWGGRTSIGLDCSALVQLACQMADVECPRDSDQQRAELGREVSSDGKGHGFARGDIVYFPGHVGIMVDGGHLVHANAHHMAVVSEPLADVLARAGDKGINAVKRID